MLCTTYKATFSPILISQRICHSFSSSRNIPINMICRLSLDFTSLMAVYRMSEYLFLSICLSICQQISWDFTAPPKAVPLFGIFSKFSEVRKQMLFFLFGICGLSFGKFGRNPFQSPWFHKTSACLSVCVRLSLLANGLSSERFTHGWNNDRDSFLIYVQTRASYCINSEKWQWKLEVKH